MAFWWAPVPTSGTSIRRNAPHPEQTARAPHSEHAARHHNSMPSTGTLLRYETRVPAGAWPGARVAGPGQVRAGRIVTIGRLTDAGFADASGAHASRASW